MVSYFNLFLSLFDSRKEVAEMGELRAILQFLSKYSEIINLLTKAGLKALDLWLA